MTRVEIEIFCDWVRRKNLARYAMSEGQPRIAEPIEIAAEVAVQCETNEKIKEVIKILEEACERREA